MQIILSSDQQPIEVKTLELFALDHIGPHDPGDFTYRVKTLLGETLDQLYPFEARLKKPPPEPGKDEDDTWILTEWERWQAALAHNQKRFEIAQERALNIAHEVLRRCIQPEDRQRILTPADYDAIYEVAVPEEVREEHIAQVLRGFFQGQIRGTRDTGSVAPLQGHRRGYRNGPSDLPGMGIAATGSNEVDYSRLFPYPGDGTGAADSGASGEGVKVAESAGPVETGKESNTLVRDRRQTLGLIAGLIFYEQRQCRALGIQSSRSLRQWLFYYSRLQEQMKRVTQAAMLNGIIQASRQTMKMIIAQAESATPERQRELLGQAKKLQAKIRQVNNQLKGLNNANFV